MFKSVHMHKEVKFNLVMRTREQSEANLTDPVRFMKPADYTTEESLTYFRTEENKMLFVDWFHKQKLSNKNLVAIANVSSPGDPVRKVDKPVFMVWELHREKFMGECKELYFLDETVVKAVYHETLINVVQTPDNPDTSFEDLFKVMAYEKLHLI